MTATVTNLAAQDGRGRSLVERWPEMRRRARFLTGCRGVPGEGRNPAPEEMAPHSAAVRGHISPCARIRFFMIRKLKSGEYRLYSRKKNAETGKRRNLGTFSSMEKAKQHEREVQYFKKH